MRTNLLKEPFHAIIAGTMLAGLSLAAAACGTTTTSSHAASGASTTQRPTSSSSSAPAAASARVGSDCGRFPRGGQGSLHSMSMDRALTAAAHDRQLTLLSAAAARAGLTARLNSMRRITLVAPANSAFMHVSMTTAGMLRSRTELSKILRYHVVAARISPAQMAHGIRASTLEGGALRFSKKGSVYEVNGATVLCGNIQTANATIYIIDKVLTPPK